MNAEAASTSPAHGTPEFVTQNWSRALGFYIFVLTDADGWPVRLPDGSLLVGKSKSPEVAARMYRNGFRGTSLAALRLSRCKLPLTAIPEYA